MFFGNVTSASTKIYRKRRLIFFVTVMWSKTFPSSFSDTANGSRLFEADIKLTGLDYARVDTSLTGNAPGADIEVQSIEKRKAIRTRRKIWPSRIIPVVLTVGEENFTPLGTFI